MNETLISSESSPKSLMHPYDTFFLESIDPAPTPTHASRPGMPGNDYRFTSRAFNPLPNRPPDPDGTSANANNFEQFIHNCIARCAEDIFRSIADEKGIPFESIRGLADNIILDRRANAYFGDTDPVRFGAAATAADDVDRDDLYFDRTGYDRDWD